MKMRFLLATLLLGFVAVHPAAASKHETMTEAEVRKVDKEAGKVTLRHGPIANLEMPPMTMVFRVKEPRLLEGLKEGEKVRFRAENLGGTLTVTRISRDKP